MPLVWEDDDEEEEAGEENVQKLASPSDLSRPSLRSTRHTSSRILSPPSQLLPLVISTRTSTRTSPRRTSRLRSSSHASMTSQTTWAPSSWAPTRNRRSTKTTRRIPTLARSSVRWRASKRRTRGCGAGGSGAARSRGFTPGALMLEECTLGDRWRSGGRRCARRGEFWLLSLSHPVF